MQLFKKRRIYLDHASATPVLAQAAQTMDKALRLSGNPGSVHEEGVAASAMLEQARETVAHELGAKARQIVFTSGLTEGNNLAILGFARKLELSGVPLDATHWITSSIEHSSILESFGDIERRGGTVTFVEPNERGVIHFKTLMHALRPNTVFVSIGWGNSEIGIVQNIAALSRVIRAHESKMHVFFHSDAGQAPLYRAPQVHTLDVDMLSLGSGKLYGPHESGALYVREPEALAPVMLGGGQERGLRAGTEKVASAAGFAAALQIISQERATEAKRLAQLRDTLAKELLERVPGIVVNGDLDKSLPHMLNVSIPSISAEYLVLALDRAGVALSTKSTCHEGATASHVVAALGGEPWRAANTLRVSLGRETSARDIRATVHALLQQLEGARSSAPAQR